MLDPLTRESFEPHVRSSFAFDTGSGGTIALELVEIGAAGTGRGPTREPFSLVFLGPMSPILPQRIYPLEHPALGRLEIFIVPIARDARGVRYEAIFN